MGTVPEEAADDPADQWIRALIAERFALSPRETDVLPLLGRTISRIQRRCSSRRARWRARIQHIRSVYVS